MLPGAGKGPLFLQGSTWTWSWGLCRDCSWATGQIPAILLGPHSGLQIYGGVWFGSEMSPKGHVPKVWLLPDGLVGSDWIVSTLCSSMD
jgi:hypothetical protein